MSPTVPTEHSSRSRSDRSAAEIWSQISDPSTWPSWNSAVDRLVLDGPFVTGTTGSLTPTNGQPLPFILVEVRPGEGYTSETTIASTVGLRTMTRLMPENDGPEAHHTVITQLAQLVGPAAEHFAPSFGDALVTGVDRTVGLLAGEPS